jgi:hypothetical protein
MHPILFKDLTPLDKERHAALALPPERKNFAFAADASLLPLTFAEVGLALRSYPVALLPEGDAIVLVALVGLPGQGNRFVDARGEWRAGTYIPAYVRGYPFIALRPADGGEPVLAFDPAADDFQAEDGQRLIGADGEPSTQLKGILAYQAEYRELAERTQAITHALQDAGVLEEGSLQIQTSGGEPQRIDGFLVVSEQKLRTLSPDMLRKLMDADALGLAYAQLFSMGSLDNLFNDPATTAPVEKPKARRTMKKAK